MQDWKGRPITAHKISLSMKASHLGGSLSILWIVTCTPLQILTVFVRNHLGAESTILGLMVGLVNLMAVLNLLSIRIVKKLKGERKQFYLITALFQRLTAFPIAFAAFRVAAGGSREEGILLVVASAVAAAIFGNTGGSVWWSWMADLIPEGSRARFFGNRSSITQVINLTFFFTATLVIDLYLERVFIVYGILYTLGGIAGLLDLLIHLTIPEPKVEDKSGFSRKDFFRPLRDKKFRSFCLILGLYLFSFNLAAPFIASHIIDPAGGGAPAVWLGITFVISQLTWIITAPFWGVLMDRMGKKPVVIIGGLYILSWTGYLFLGPGNYPFLLPVIAITGGLLAPAFWEGISQFMLSLSPERYRTSYSAWYWTAFGVSASVSPLLGGFLFDFLTVNPIVVGGFNPDPFQVLTTISILMVLFSLTHMGRIPIPREKSVRAVISTILNPGVFRAVTNIGLLAKPTRAENVEKALREVRGSAHNLSFSEIVIRLDDPDVEVREAAAMALARLKSEEAEEELIRRLRDPDALSRPFIARALGESGAIKAVPFLIDALQDRSEDLQVEAAAALGKIRVEESSQPILKSLREGGSLRVRISSAEAAARMGLNEAAEEIFTLMHGAGNWILRRQLAIAMGDLFGVPGEIYHYMTGEFSRNVQMIYRLTGGVERLAAGLLRKHAPLLKKEELRKEQVRTIRSKLQAAAAAFDQKEFAAGTAKLEEVWALLEPHLPEAPLINWYRRRLGRHIAEGGQASGQDFILELYSLYRLLRKGY